MHLLVTRPEPDASCTARGLAELGHCTLVAPLMQVRLTGGIPDLHGVAALVFTSANGVRAFAAASAERGLPVFAVGAVTAAAARDAGFAEAQTASGDMAALADLIGAQPDLRGKTILHVAGRHVAGNLAARLPGITLRRAVLYEAQAAPNLPQAISEALAQGRPAPLDGALFFSPRSARLFEKLVRQADLETGLRGLTAYCLSPAVAAALTALSWNGTAIAAVPTMDALLRLLESRAPDQGIHDA